MKKVYLITALIVETLACAGAWTIQRFTSRKMGMLRWVNGICNKMTKKADLDTVNVVIMVALAVLLLFLVFRAIDRVKERSGAFDGLVCLSLCSAGIYIAYTLAYTRKLMAAYYLVSPVLLLGAVTAIIFLAVAVCKNR